MKQLATTNPKRLFTFGCSFTDYRWATWANILAFEFDCEFYNFGKSGAGNAFIANQITQTNQFYNFTKDDLIIVCWTNISREDRWTRKKGWITPGNIYSQQDYDSRFVKNWANSTHFALRDFSYIDLIDNYLNQKTNYHFLAMCNISEHINQWENSTTDKEGNIAALSELYRNTLNKIAPSFYKVLWNNDIDNKWNKDWREIHPHFSDGHPTILEHYEYLTKTFDYNFSDKTRLAVEETHTKFVEYIRAGYKKTKIDCGLHDMPQTWANAIHDNFRLRKEAAIPPNLFH